MNEPLRFPREPENAGGWVIHYRLLKKVKSIFDEDNPGYSVSQEEIEAVLLAVEKMVAGQQESDGR
jgi:hypothetical protein